MGAHLRNDRDISAEQRARQLKLQQNFTVSPAAEEQLRRIREQSASAARHREKFTLARTTGFGPGSIAERRQSAGGFFSPSLEYVDPRTGSNRQIRHDSTPSGSLGVEPIPIRPENSGIPSASTNPFREQSGELSRTDGRRMAQEARDFNLMRMVLNQAIASQDLLTNLVGREEMLRVSESWVARDKLAHLDRSTLDNSDNRTQIPVQNQAGPPVVPTSSHPSANPNHAGFHHHNPRPAIPANRPQRELRPTPEIQYLGLYHNQPVALRPTMAPHIYADPSPQPHYGYQEYQYQYHQPHAQHPHPYVPHHHQGGGNRGPGRRQTDPTTRMVRMGESFNRVERILARYVVEKGANETSLIPNIRIRTPHSLLKIG
ncbi:hypothetical protein PSHT_00708 [Puccinia striiformis]|uniref:Uncharacterized protein n=1 Tax=Puccinia striiformis TaxID=27350 RepID=A0A2S4WME0_9BASI|nr:hypothetical protein PSHT_00708 [Puccinia striiformis]